MMRAPPLGMKRVASLGLLGTLLASCSGDEIDLAGSLAPDASESVDAVWVVGGPERTLVQNDSFRITGVQGGSIDLRFTSGSDEVGRMVITGLSRGARVDLADVWFKDGVAFPRTVRRSGGDLPAVNGIRIGAEEDVPERVSLRGTVLSVSDDLLLVRPESGGLPDLRVVAGAMTARKTVDGDPGDLGRLEFGDTVEVQGTRESEFVAATSIVGPRSLDLRGGAEGGTSGSGGAARSGGGGSSGPGATGASDDGRGRVEPSRGNRGRGQGQGRGRGRGGGV